MNVCAALKRLCAHFCGIYAASKAASMLYVLCYGYVVAIILSFQ